MEEELKRELKKLQKHRDAIKGWASSSEVKIKTNLLEGRRNIEVRMEAFKAIERESKMKAYSKEGLMRDAPTTAEERRRMKTTQWMQALVDKLSDDAEALEAELEALEEAGGGGGKKKASAEITPEQLLGRVISTHRFHVDKLEALIAAVDAGTVDPDEADNLKGAGGGGGGLCVAPRPRKTRSHPRAHSRMHSPLTAQMTSTTTWSKRESPSTRRR
jgi:CCR4-NOT transcription complex subunit 3